ncbi:MAG TPA: hypothetical protein VN018_04190 [Brevundimonas sp.]|nr:hypothetical protein [Brevundimonas sp.]
MRRAIVLASLVGMLAASAPLSMAHASTVEDVIRDARVTPKRREGLLFGCELNVLVLRRPAADQPPTEAFAGSVMVLNHMSGEQAAVLRLGIAGPDRQLRPLSHGVFVGDGAETRREFIRREEPDGSGFEMFVYGMGPQTSAFFSRLADLGIGEIAYQSVPDAALQRFRIDVSGRPELLAEWRGCLSDLADSPPPA